MFFANTNVRRCTRTLINKVFSLFCTHTSMYTAKQCKIFNTKIKVCVRLWTSYEYYFSLPSNIIYTKFFTRSTLTRCNYKFSNVCILTHRHVILTNLKLLQTLIFSSKPSLHIFSKEHSFKTNFKIDVYPLWQTQATQKWNCLLY